MNKKGRRLCGGGREGERRREKITESGKEDEHNGGHMPAGPSRRRERNKKKTRGERRVRGPEREENNAMFLYHTIYTDSLADRYTPGASSGM